MIATVPISISERLSALPAFAGVPAGGLATFAGLGELRRLEPGERLLTEGAPVDTVFVILEGRLKLSRELESGRSLVLALLGPGEAVGVAAALSGEPADGSADALEGSWCLAVPRDELLAAFAAQPALMVHLLPPLTRHLVECKNCIVELTQLRVARRFATLFLKLAEASGRPAAGGTLVPIALSRQELADMTGTTIETAIRVMSRWHREGLLETLPEGRRARGGGAAGGLSRSPRPLGHPRGSGPEP